MARYRVRGYRYRLGAARRRSKLPVGRFGVGSLLWARTTWEQASVKVAELSEEHRERAIHALAAGTLLFAELGWMRLTHHRTSTLVLLGLLGVLLARAWWVARRPSARAPAPASVRDSTFAFPTEKITKEEF